MNTTRQLSEHQKRILIAQAMGYTFRQPDHGRYQEDGKCCWATPPVSMGMAAINWDVPDYFHSLDACHEIERFARNRNQFGFLEHQRALWRVVTGRPELHHSIDYMHSLAMWDVTCATAAQRAEAVGICLGLWT